MKQENREKIIRALGILEGIWFSASPKTQDGIVSATEMLEDALDKEGKEWRYTKSFLQKDITFMRRGKTERFGTAGLK